MEKGYMSEGWKRRLDEDYLYEPVGDWRELIYVPPQDDESEDVDAA